MQNGGMKIPIRFVPKGKDEGHELSFVTTFDCNELHVQLCPSVTCK